MSVVATDVVLYHAATQSDLDGSTVGGGIDTLRRPDYTQPTAGDTGEAVSSAAGDTSPYPFPSHSGDRKHVSLTDALASFGLPSLDAGAVTSASSDVPLHCVPVWPSDRYAMVAAIPPDSAASAWDNNTCLACGRRTRNASRVRCSGCGSVLPRPVVRDASAPGGLRLITGFATSYQRMDPLRPAATVTTASGHVGSDRTIHPSENRVLSPLECALLQTFPRSFDWGDAPEKSGIQKVRAMIGEAVPPLFTRKHGRVLAQLLRGIPPRVALRSADPRCRAAETALERSRLQPVAGR